MNKERGLAMKEELLKGLTEEQMAKVKACKSQEEMLALAKEEGIDLTEEQLEAISGGGTCTRPTAQPAYCEKCGWMDYCDIVGNGGSSDYKYTLKCRHCGNKFYG